ncbi:MAG: electron transfer flavoprotein alpha/ beta subunit, partial [Chloroflexi bacterium]|nr:electron transfer flavoprotein alpha/ beta subunit [Chloroflexota bacterium]
MNIAVCIKQVPFIYDVKFDAEKKTIVREGVQLVMNSLDRRAITQALIAREQFGGTITVLSMGPDQARNVLYEAMATGADRAILLSDRAFAGSDTLATARALALALKKAGPFDLIFCGRFSVDAETGQVGPEVAELLDLPQATNVRGVEFSPEGDAVTVQREIEEGYETLRFKLPALITAGEWLNTPRRATPDQIAEAKNRPVEVWSAADLSEDTSIFGLSGSPTYVHEIRSLEPARDGHIVQGDDPEAAAAELVRYLQGRGLFTPWERSVAKAPSGRSVSADPAKAIWVVAELLNGHPKGVTLELLGKAAELAEQSGGEVVAVVVGADVAPAVAELTAYGADRVLVAEGPDLGHYDTEQYTALLTGAIQARQPGVVLLGATVDGRDLAPRVAARLSLGLTGDCVDLELDAEGALV